MIDRQRKSTRLRQFDYGGANTYFVTICLQDRQPLLGSVASGGEIALSPAGIMTRDAWLSLRSKFRNVELDEFIIMPDHLHAIVSTGVDPEAVEAASLLQCVGWFKTVSTKRYGKGVRDAGWPPYNGQLWQRSFHDHVIRNDLDMRRCREYIEANPSRWLESHADAIPVGES